MAKRPSLVGTGRQALAAAMGEKPAAHKPVEAAPAPRPVRRAQQSARVKPAPTSTNKPPVAEPMPAASTSAAPTAPNATSIYRDLLAFGAEQLQRSLAAAAALSRCQTPTEVIATQAQFARDTAARFGGEALKLMQLGGKVVLHRQTIPGVGTRRAGDDGKAR
jgi:hypothetical protein